MGMFTTMQRSALIGLFFIVVIGSLITINVELGRMHPKPKTTHLDVVTGLMGQRERFISNHNGTSEGAKKISALKGIEATDELILKVVKEFNITTEELIEIK
jgi:hypothetical protein